MAFFAALFAWAVCWSRKNGEEKFKNDYKRTLKKKSDLKKTFLIWAVAMFAAGMLMQAHLVSGKGIFSPGAVAVLLAAQTLEWHVVYGIPAELRCLSKESAAVALVTGIELFALDVALALLVLTLAMIAWPLTLLAFMVFAGGSIITSGVTTYAVWVIGTGGQ